MGEEAKTCCHRWPERFRLWRDPACSYAAILVFADYRNVVIAEAIEPIHHSYASAISFEQPLLIGQE